MYAELYDFFGDSLATRFGTGAPTASPPDRSRRAGASHDGAARKMPQLTADSAGSPRHHHQHQHQHQHHDAAAARPPQRPPRPRVPDVFPAWRSAPRGAPRFSFVIAGRQAGRRCQGRRFQSSFPQHRGPGHGCRYAQKLPVIGRAARAARRGPRAEYSLLLPL